MRAKADDLNMARLAINGVREVIKEFDGPIHDNRITAELLAKSAGDLAYRVNGRDVKFIESTFKMFPSIEFIGEKTTKAGDSIKNLILYATELESSSKILGVNSVRVRDLRVAYSQALACLDEAHKFVSDELTATWERMRRYEQESLREEDH